MILSWTALAAESASANEKTLRVGGRTLTLSAPPRCAGTGRPLHELAQFLRQYDPAHDPRDDSTDERPRSRSEIAAIKAGLVNNGLHFPDGSDSVVTWMDFDGDGSCDFTAAAGIGGMRPVDRMFLFRGMPGRKFLLVDAYHTYMEGSSIVVPYVPLAVSGETLPLLVSKDTLLQWQPVSKQFAVCGPGRQRSMPPVLSALCPHAQAIYSWAADQLPHTNALPY